MFGWRDRRERAAAKWLARMGNESAPFDREAFESWRDSHPGNARAFAETVRSWSLPLPVDATRYAAATARGDSPAPASGAIPALALAATLLVGLIALATSDMFWRSDADRNTVRVASPLITTGQQSRAYRLSDGSIATLGPDSELRIAYSDEARTLMLVRGAARFAVAHEATRRFEVKAGDAVVTARGTVFTVRITPQGTKVALYRGAVDVARVRGGQPTGAVRKLAPGETIILPQESPSAAGALPGKAASDARIVTFARTPVPDAVAAFEARTGVRIVIDPRLRRETVTGGFDAEDARGFADMLAAMFDLTVSRGAGGELVLSPRR